MKMVKKILAIILCLTMIAVLVVGCAKSDAGTKTDDTKKEDTKKEDNKKDDTKKDDGNEKKELKKLSISHHPALHGLPAYVAIEKGFFEEEGLDVDMTIYIAGATQMEALPSGSWACGGGGATAGCVGTIGYDLQILGYVGWDGPIDIYVREDSDIYQAGKGHVDGYPEIYGTAENWKGKNFLLPQGTTAHLALLGTLNALGLTEDDITITHMEVPAAQNAFAAGEGDAVGQWINFALQSQDFGWKKVSSCADADVQVPLVLFASDDIINSDPDTVVAYIKGYLKAWNWITNNYEEAWKLYYQFEIEEGVETTEDACKTLMLDYKMPSIDDMLAQYEVGEDGDTEYHRALETMLSYFKAMGKYTDEQVELALSQEKMNSELFVRALNELKEEGF